MKRFLALDIGGVCLSVHPERCLGLLGVPSLSALPPELLRLETEDFERGRLSEAEFYDEFRRICGEGVSFETVRRAFMAMIGDPNPGMTELVSSLPERGIQPVFFSDTSSAHLEEVRRKFPAASAVSEGVYSFEVGAKKPELPMFETFELRYGTPCLYVDDRADLIDAARKHGWNAVRFTSAGEIQDAIAAL